MSRILPARSSSSSTNSSTLTSPNQLQGNTAPSTVRVVYKVVVGNPTSSQRVTSNSAVAPAQSNPTFTSHDSAAGLQQNTKNLQLATIQNKEWTLLQMSNGESYFVKKPVTNSNMPTSFTKALPSDLKILVTSAQNDSLSPCVTNSISGSISSVSRKTAAPGVCTGTTLLAVQENSTKETKTLTGHCDTLVVKDVNNLKMSEEEIDLSPREKRIRRLKEMVKAKEEEIEKIRQEINSNISTASTTQTSSSVTSSSFASDSLPSVSESTSLLANKTSNQTRKIQPRKKPPSQKRSDHTFSPGSCTLPFVPDASDRLFRQLCGLEIVVDSLFKSQSISGTNLTQDTSAS